MAHDGATVRLIVSERLLGDVLHRLEWHAGIFIVDCDWSGERGQWDVYLRSDLFPQEFDGWLVSATLTTDSHRIRWEAVCFDHGAAALSQLAAIDLRRSKGEIPC